jgi:hypothetical protein
MNCITVCTVFYDLILNVKTEDTAGAKCYIITVICAGTSSVSEIYSILIVNLYQC